jgi:hypothetical protein
VFIRSDKRKPLLTIRKIFPGSEPVKGLLGKIAADQHQ